MIKDGKIKRSTREIGKKSIESVDLSDIDRIEVRFVKILIVFSYHWVRKSRKS